MEYISRIVDDVIDRKTEAFNAVSITGPKGCRKTRTARERCKTVIEFQDEDKREGYLAVAETAPKLFLKNPKPILFDEWQDAPKIWGTIRKACDDNPESVGEFYLTGSSSKKINTPHTGTGRITEVTMYPMTLFETGESNGSISLFKLLEDEAYDIDGLTTDIKLEDLFFAVCRGGWPRCMALSKDSAKLEIAKDYYRQIYQKDISAIDGVNRNPEWARTLLWSYARNMATTAKRKNIFSDVKATQNVTDVTLSSYIDALELLYVVKDIDAWTPHLRSKTAIRAAKKHIFVEPSIGLAEKHNARVMHYTDDMGVEADAVYQLEDGRYALIEIKTGVNKIPEAEKFLLRFKDIILKYNEKALEKEKHPRDVYKEPSALIVICANATMAYTTESGVRVVPVGCLRD